jgi:signal transduction histidine kinase
MTVTITQAQRLLTADVVAAGDAVVIARDALARCRDDVGRCIDELRELSRGIYPPVLAARGLVAALRGRARASRGAVKVVAAEDLDGYRFSPEAELAAYFTCLEALQNAAKHAPGVVAVVELSLAGDDLCLSVHDGGPGFDAQGATATGSGTGLLGMADRVGAVGGVLSIESRLGHGTTVRGRLPAGPAPAFPATTGDALG